MICPWSCGFGGTSGCTDPVCVGSSDKDVAPIVERLNPLSFLPQRDARYVQEVSFFLNTAGIRQDHPRMLLQHEHVNVRYGRNDCHALRLPVELLEKFPS